MNDRQDIFEQETYLSFEEGYPERPVSWFKTAILPRVQSLLTGRRLLLDAGCASGYYTKEFAPFIEKVVGVDYAHSRIKYAKDRFESNNLKFVHSRVDQLNVYEKFDAIFTSMVFQHMPLEIKVRSFENLFTLASEDCLFLMYDFNSKKEDIGNGWVEPISPQWINKHIKGWQLKSCEQFCNEYQTPDSIIWEYQLYKTSK